MTAVEFLEIQFQKYENWIHNKHDAEQCTIFELFQDFKLAKKMHKQQIKNAYNQGYREGLEDANIRECIPDVKDVAECSNAEFYYNQTFNK